ncbi:MAG: hypothetical protein WCK70_00705 [Chloroflexales bacterium]|jgi:hypothetical protein
MSNTENEGLVGVGAALVGGAVRLSLTTVSIPLNLLPDGTRRRVRTAIAEAARAIVAIHVEISNASERIVDDIFSGAESTLSLPNTDQISERARAFTARLSRAADEFSTSIGRVANQAVDGVERTVARVDEWVEKPSAAPKS